MSWRQSLTGDSAVGQADLVCLCGEYVAPSIPLWAWGEKGEGRRKGGERGAQTFETLNIISSIFLCNRWKKAKQGCIQRGGALGFPPSSLSFPPPPRIRSKSNIESQKFLGEHATIPPRGRTNVSPPPPPIKIKKSCMQPCQVTHAKTIGFTHIYKAVHA